jgi:hypothetical protein
MDLQSSKQLKINESDKGQWFALETQEFGWVAGYVMSSNKKQMRFRIMKRQVNQTLPSTTSLEGWEACNSVTTTYFFESKSFPRAIKMGFKSPNI